MEHLLSKINTKYIVIEIKEKTKEVYIFFFTYIVMVIDFESDNGTA